MKGIALACSLPLAAVRTLYGSKRKALSTVIAKGFCITILRSLLFLGLLQCIVEAHSHTFLAERYVHL